MMANTMLLLREDTPTDYPGLAKEFYEAGRPFREELSSKESDRDKYDVMAKRSTTMIGKGASIARRYAAKNPELFPPIDNSRHKDFVSAIGSLSPLNKKLTAIGLQENPRNAVINDALQNVGVNAYIHNPIDLIANFARKLYFGIDPILLRGTVIYRKAKIFSEELYDFESLSVPAKKEITYPLKIGNAEAHFAYFNQVGRWLYKLDNHEQRTYYFAPTLVPIFAVLFACFQLISVLVFKKRTEQVGVLAFIAVCLMGYLSSVALAQILGTSRYHFAMLPITLIIFFSPLVLIEAIYVVGITRAGAWLARNLSLDSSRCFDNTIDEKPSSEAAECV
jgi:hypothetical protein